VGVTAGVGVAVGAGVGVLVGVGEGERVGDGVGVRGLRFTLTPGKWPDDSKAKMALGPLNDAAALAAQL